MSILPNQWSAEDLAKDALTAKSVFRTERVGEPLELYQRFYALFAEQFAALTPGLTLLAADPIDVGLLADMVRSRDAQKAFRYLAAPPISKDDLEAVADTSIAPRILQNDPVRAKRVRDVVLTIIDPYRFPWMIVPRREPTDDEIDRAVAASAAMAAASEVGTHRRNTSKNAQEDAVKAMLASIDMKEVPARDIPILTAAPEPGTFCGESRLAGTRADVIARLNDGRVMAIECKVSNSTVNSYKRIVHDTGGKAAHWYQQLGKAQVLPCAVLSGVFSPANLAQVQNETGVHLFWQHRLDDLAGYVKGTGTP